MKRNCGGWTLFEMVIVLAIIGILAAILTPIITSYVERARLSTAAADVKSIAAAVIQFNTDTRTWPIYSGTFSTLSGSTYDILYSPGDAALVGPGTGWNGTSTFLNSPLNMNSMGLPIDGRAAWKGAYLELASDPWGTRYYLTGLNLRPDSPNAAFVVSAGPNQTLDTVMNQLRGSALTVSGDDIVTRIR